MPNRFFVLFFSLSVSLCLGSCTFLRTTIWNVPGQNDVKKFPNQKIAHGGLITELKKKDEAGIPSMNKWGISHPYKPGMPEEQLFRKTKTMAFLVLNNDTLVYEYYDKNHTENSIFTSFSMVKVFVSTLIGIAVHEGYIDSLTQSASDFLPELKKDSLEKITIKDLLEMTSGLKTSESYANPFSTSTRMYYSRKLCRVTKNLSASTEPGKKFKYQNLNTQLLSRIIEKATGRNVAQYLQEKIWIPMGMESDASWSLDRPGGEVKAFCCLNAIAGDFARFGLLFANGGIWNGNQIIPSEWINEVCKLNNGGLYQPRYRLHWYTSAENEDWYAEGLLGQFIYTCPEKKFVIVRLGQGFQLKTKWYSMFKFLAGLESKPIQESITKKDLKIFEGEFVFGTSSDGDSSLVGELVRVKALNKGLRISTDLYKPYIVYYSGNGEFYNVKNARRLQYYQDGHDNIVQMNWYRRGASWDLKKKF